MRTPLLSLILFWLLAEPALAGAPLSGLACWYGEAHRGKLMANGQRFDPDQLTAAAWDYPLGTRLRVTAVGTTNSVEVIITDRGPNRRFLRQGRILDLSRGAFQRLANPERGLIEVTVQK